MSTSITTTKTWAMCAFGGTPSPMRITTPQVYSYIVPSRADVAGVAHHADPASSPLSLDLMALVETDADGNVIPDSLSEVRIAVVARGDTVPEWSDAAHGPRLICQMPCRYEWVYLLGSVVCHGPAELYTDRFRPRGVSGGGSA